MSAGTFTQLHYHLVFAVKHRAGLRAPAWRPRLWAYLGGILTEHDHNRC